MKKKTSRITFKHKVGRSNKAVIVTAVSNVHAIQAITLKGVGKLSPVQRKRYFIFNREFPFIHRKEIGVYFAKIK